MNVDVLQQSPLLVLLNDLVKVLNNELEKEKHNLEELKTKVGLDV